MPNNAANGRPSSQLKSASLIEFITYFDVLDDKAEQVCRKDKESVIGGDSYCITLITTQCHVNLSTILGETIDG